MADKPVEEEPQHSTADYAKYPQPEKPIRNWTRIFTIFIIVLILAGGGAGAYWYLKNHKTAKPKATTQTTQAPAKISSPTKSYTSPNLYLTFSYPSDWTIADNGGGAMTVTSPTMKLKDATGQQVSGTIVMTITASIQKLPGFTTGNATATIASQKITYAKPTQTQRANTYITFVAYSTTTASSGLDAIYVSGNNGYTLGQAVPQTDLVQVAPIIGLTFLNSSGRALTIAASNWSDSAFSTPLLTMLQSMAIT